jgi:hypothetical protein
MFAKLDVQSFANIHAVLLLSNSLVKQFPTISVWKIFFERKILRITIRHVAQSLLIKLNLSRHRLLFVPRGQTADAISKQIMPILRHALI